MFGKKISKLSTFLTVLTLSALLPLQAAFAQMAPGAPGQQATANTFSAFGTVTSVDPTAKTVTITITRAGRLLKGEIGNPVTFQVSSTAWVGPMGQGGMMGGMGCICRGQGGGMMGGQGGGMMGQGRTGQGGMMGPGHMGPGGTGTPPAGNMPLTDIQQGDEVHFMGYQDAATHEYVLTRLMVWL